MKSVVSFYSEHPRAYAAFLFSCWVLLLVYGVQVFTGLPEGGYQPPYSESQVTNRYFTDRFVSPLEDLQILVSHPTWTVDNPLFQSAFQEFKGNITSALPVYAMLSWFDYPQSVSNLSPDRHHAKVTARTYNNADITMSQYKATTAGNPLSIIFAGTSLANRAVNAALATDIAGIEQGALPVLIVILVLVFEGVIAMLFPLFLAGWTVACVLACLRATSLGFNVSQFTINATTIFGVGLAIDFSLFMHIRFREEMRKNGRNVQASIERAMATSGRAIIFSTCTLTACLSGVLQFHEYYLTTMALAVMYSAVTACIGALTILPLMYILLGERSYYLNTDKFYGFLYSLTATVASKIGAYSPTPSPAHSADLQGEEPRSTAELVKPDDGFEEEMEKVKQGYWFRVVTFVMQHPWFFLLALMGCLAALMWVFISKVSFGSGGISLLPTDSEVRANFDQFNTYIPNSAGSVLNVYMQTIAPNGTRAPDFLTALDAYSTQLKTIPHVTGVRNIVRYNNSVTLSQYISIYATPYDPTHYAFTKNLLSPFFITDFNSIARTDIFFDVGSNDVSMHECVRSVRGFTSAPALSQYLSAYGVTGDAAVSYDQQQDLASEIPNLVIVIAISMGLFLTLLTGSFIIPIKAVITAALSIISSFAFLVLVYQEGPQSAKDLLHFVPNGTLDPSNLIFIFAVSFGLSLDYEIFMISRINELWERTHDHPFAVAAGIEQSARAITLAALLLCVVLGAFLASKIIVLQEIGMGIGLTILLDATVIRCLLVPSMMALFGKWTWWAPKPVQDFVKWAGLMEKEYAPSTLEDKNVKDEEKADPEG